MNLKNLNEDLNRIPPGQPPVLEHMLHSMYALCLDIQKHCGHRIYNGVVNDYRLLNNSLTQMANLLCKIYDTHSGGLNQNVNVTFPAEKLREIEEKTREAEQNTLDHKNETARLEKAQAELQSRLTAGQAALAERQAAQAQVQKLQDTLRETTARLQEIDLPGLERETAALQNRKAQLEAEQAAAGEALTALQAEEARLAGLVSSARAEEQRLNALQDAHKQVLLDLEGTSGAIKSAEEELAYAKISLLAAENQRDSLLKQIADTNAAAQVLDRESGALRPQYEAAEQLRLEKQADRDGISSKLTTAQAQSAALEQESGALTAKLEETHQDISRMKEDIVRLESSITQAEQELGSLQGQTAVLREELILQNGRNEQFRSDELKSAQEALNAAGDTMRQLIAKRDGMKQERSRMMSEESRINGEISTINVRILELKPKLDRSAQDLEAIQALHEQKKAELDSLNLRIGSISKKLEDLVKQIEETKAVVERTDNTELESKYEATLAELKEMNSRLEHMRADLPGKARELADLKETYRQVLGQKTQAEETFHRLSEELRCLQAPEVLQQIRQLENKSQILEEIRTSILAAAARLQIPGEDIREAMDWNLQDVNATLEGLRLSIQKVTGELSGSIL